MSIRIAIIFAVAAVTAATIIGNALSDVWGPGELKAGWDVTAFLAVTGFIFVIWKFWP